MRLYSNSSGASARLMLSSGSPVRAAQAAISAESPTQIAVAGSWILLHISTLTSESLPPPIGSRVRRGRRRLGASLAATYGASGPAAGSLKLERRARLRNGWPAGDCRSEAKRLLRSQLL